MFTGRFSGFLAILSFALLLATFHTAMLSEVSARYGQPVDTALYYELKTVSEDSYEAFSFVSSYRDLLSDDDLLCYDVILTLLQNYEASGSLEFLDTGICLDSDRLVTISRMVLYDHPKYGVIWSGGLMTRGGHELQLQLLDTNRQILSDETYTMLSQRYVYGSTDFDILRSAVSYLSSICSYDGDAGPHHFDDTGVLTDGKACCQGMSFAAKRLLNAAGLKCQVLTGYTSEGGYHMLNAVYLSEQDAWILVDLTCTAGKPSCGQLDGIGLNVKQADLDLSRMRFVPEKTAFRWKLEDADTRIGVLAEQRCKEELFGNLFP